jgi:hypothetical protein
LASPGEALEKHRIWNTPTRRSPPKYLVVGCS